MQCFSSVGLVFQSCLFYLKFTTNKIKRKEQMVSTSEHILFFITSVFFRGGGGVEK